MSFITTAMLPLNRYAQFSGRSSRREYWTFTLCVFACNLVAYTIFSIGLAMDIGILAGIGGIVYLAISLASLIPSLAVTVRRLHDTDRSGWAMLISIVPFGAIFLLIWLFTAGAPAANRFGPPPSV